jgi:hypothetical protein
MLDAEPSGLYVVLDRDQMIQSVLQSFLFSDHNILLIRTNSFLKQPFSFPTAWKSLPFYLPQTSILWNFSPTITESIEYPIKQQHNPTHLLA